MQWYLFFKILLHLKKVTRNLSVSVFNVLQTACNGDYYEEKSRRPYWICKEHKSKEWILSSVQRLLKRFKENESMKKRTGSDWPIDVTTDENIGLVEELISSQEEFEGIYKSSCEIARNAYINRSSVRRLVKRRKINRFKRMKIPQMNSEMMVAARVRRAMFSRE